MNKNSEYKEIIRQEKVFPNLVIKKSLEDALPFKSKSKNQEAKYNEEKEFLKKHNLPYNKPLKSYLSGTEKDVFSMLQRLQTIKNLKDKKAKITKKDLEEEQNKKNEEILKKQKKKTINKVIRSKSKNKSKKAQDQ